MEHSPMVCIISERVILTYMDTKEDPCKGLRWPKNHFGLCFFCGWHTFRGSISRYVRESLFHSMKKKPQPNACGWGNLCLIDTVHTKMMWPIPHNLIVGGPMPLSITCLSFLHNTNWKSLSLHWRLYWEWCHWWEWETYKQCEGGL